MKYLMGFGILLMIIGWILSLYYKLDNLSSLTQGRFTPIFEHLKMRYELLNKLIEQLHNHLEQDHILLDDIRAKLESINYTLADLALEPTTGSLMRAFTAEEDALTEKIHELLSIMNKRPAVFSLNDINALLSQLGALERPLATSCKNFNQAIHIYQKVSHESPMHFVARLFRMDDAESYRQQEAEN